MTGSTLGMGTSPPDADSPLTEVTRSHVRAGEFVAVPLA